MSSLFHTLNISKQDLLSRVNDLDVTSNNLANVNTAGYKAARSNFQELLNAQFKEGSKLGSTQLLTGQGTLKATENPLDWAIQGEGFFQVTLPDGTTGYTRDGQFSVDANNQLVSPSGYPLVWTGTVTAGMININITATGQVTATDATGAVVNVGAIQLARFPNPSGLTNFGDNVWLETDISGAVQTGTPGEAGYGAVLSSHVEQSNVDLSQELTHMVTLQRSFTMSVRAFQQTDSMITQAINMRKA